EQRRELETLHKQQLEHTQTRMQQDSSLRLQQIQDQLKTQYQRQSEETLRSLHREFEAKHNSTVHRIIEEVRREERQRYLTEAFKAAQAERARIREILSASMAKEKQLRASYEYQIQQLKLHEQTK